MIELMYQLQAGI